MKAAAITTLPLVGATWPGQGGTFAGIRSDGTFNYALILAADVPPKALPWAKALAWAKKLKIDGHTDWVVPDRFDSALLYATVRDKLDTSDWYWTSTQHSDAGYAWFQYFGYGSQSYTGKSYEGRVRAVRRLTLDPSILQPKPEDLRGPLIAEAKNLLTLYAELGVQATQLQSLIARAEA